MRELARGRKTFRTIVGRAVAPLAVLAIGVGVGASPAAATPTPPVPPSPHGYILAAADGGVFAFGRTFRGSAGNLHLRAPIVGIASTPDDGGYWIVASDGGVFAFGGAHFFGSLGGLSLNRPIVAIAATPDGKGYWLLGADGGVFAFGDARFFGSMSGAHVLAPFVGIASTADAGGYRMLTESGEVFSFGDALRPGDPPALQAAPGRYVGMARILISDRGVVLTTDDGMLYEFDPNFASCNTYPPAPPPMNAPVVGVAPASPWCSQYLVGSDGGVFPNGGGGFFGSAGNLSLVAPIVGIAT